ncbi:MAG: RNA polymerase sigma factor [Bacteroidales bacterium]|nr:RNA polymerase sigma factor [Bacteroidales bacterium]MDD4822984.1 RNA polymerase sigma factor [Bacteroidales bacterium]
MSDQQIIEEIQKGNQAMFRLLVDKYQRMVFVTVIGFLHSKEDAEDLTQEIFVKVWASLPSFKGDAEFSTWLYRIVVNNCINTAQKKQRNRFVELAEEWIQSVFHVESGEKDSQQLLEANETDAAIQKAIDSLPINQRTAFLLSVYDELSQKEIANVMNRSEGAVEQLLQRAKANLQKKLGSPVGK